MVHWEQPDQEMVAYRSVLRTSHSIVVWVNATVSAADVAATQSQ